SLKTSIKTITYLSDIGCLEIQGASLLSFMACLLTTSIFFWGLRRYTSISNALMTKDIVMSALH
ncbi:hypothetical protein, partial [Escherichia coli]|uniref:hypothetical protein n=1 Tax=Escherichia coli TaxID=562 RepID=UPI002263B4F1